LAIDEARVQTVVRLPADLVWAAKQEAARRRQTYRDFVEAAIRAELSKPRPAPTRSTPASA